MEASARGAACVGTGVVSPRDELPLSISAENGVAADGVEDETVLFALNGIVVSAV